MSSSTWSKTIKFNWIEKMWTQLNSTSFSSADLLCHNFGMPRWRTSDQLLYGGDATMFWTVCLFLGTPKLVLFRWHVYPPSCFRSSGVCELSMFYFVAMFAHLHVSFKRCVWALHVHKIIDGSSSMESQNQSHGGNSGYKPSRRPSMVNCEEVGIDG